LSAFREPATAIQNGLVHPGFLRGDLLAGTETIAFFIPVFKAPPIGEQEYVFVMNTGIKPTVRLLIEDVVREIIGSSPAAVILTRILAVLKSSIIGGSIRFLS
jgi:hypothetical protein